MSARKLNSFRPNLESLEQRAVMTTGWMSGTTLNVSGSNGNDNIVVHQDGSRVIVDGVGWVDVSNVQRITVDASAGNDRVQIALSGDMTRRTSVSGGTGSDTLVYPQGSTFAAFSGFEGYQYGPGATGSMGGGSTGGGSTGGGSTGGGSTGGTGQVRGWYFEARLIISSGNYGSVSVIGPYNTQQEAASNQTAWSQRGWQITKSVYGIGVDSGGGTSGNGGNGGNGGTYNGGWGQPGATTLTEHGYWGGANRAPAERAGLMTPSNFNDLETWARMLIAQGKLPNPIDRADYAAMLHDIRLKWARDHVNSNLQYDSHNGVIAYINRQAQQDFTNAIASGTLGSAARNFADRASYLFQYLSTYVN